MDFEVNGGVFNRAARSFSYLGAFLAGPATIAMQKEFGEIILAKAKQLVPVRTGALKNSGRVVMSQSRKGVEVRFGNSGVRYAMVVEYGRFSYAPFAPRPYIRPAVRYASKKFRASKQMKIAERKTLPRRWI
tara:strand:- start:71 stop:466 length:396 start_codon:yes stop_codon:yes gene_type:complete